MESVDFVIITALQKELDAVLSKLESYQLISTASDILPFYQATLGKAQLVITRSGAGNILATHAATTVLKEFKPHYLLMVGIAAGFDGKVHLGDVLVATDCYYDGAGKETSAGKLPEPRYHPTSAFLLGRSRDYTALDWKDRIAIHSPTGDFQPSVHHGVIVSSETVVGDPARMASFIEVHRGVRALAMEGYGVAEAAHSHHIEFLEIRGICDFGDAQKNDDWHQYAAHVAAAYTVGLIHYIDSLPKTPRDNRGADYGISPEIFAKYVAELGVTDSALESFFKILEQARVDRVDLDSKLREIAGRYKELLAKVATFTSDDPEVKRLLTEAQTALEATDFDTAEQLYNQASDRDVAAAKQLQEIAEKRLVSAAEAKYANGKMKWTQLAYREAAGYYQAAAKLLPAGHEEDRATYLNEAGVALYYAGEYQQALPLYQEASAIWGEVLGKQHPDYAESLNNLAGLYDSQGQYEQALPLYQEALAILTKVLGEQHPSTQMVKRNYEECLNRN